MTEQVWAEPATDEAKPKSVLYRKYGSNKDKESNGVWVDDKEVVLDDGTSPGYCIRRSGGANADYAKALERACAPYKAAIAKNTLTKEQSDTILLNTFVDAVLVDWRNIPDTYTEQLMSYTPAGAKRLFQEIPELFVWLQRKASDLATFQDTVLEETTKNS